MTLKSKVGSKISAVVNRADMLGAVVGYLGTFSTISGSESGSFVQTLINRHINAVKIHNINKLSDVPWRIGQDSNWNSMIFTGVGLGIAGIVASYMPNVVPWQGSVSSIAKKAGFGMAVGGVLATVVGTIAEGSGGSVVEHSSGSSSSNRGASTSGRIGYPIDGTVAPRTAKAWA